MILKKEDLEKAVLGCLNAVSKLDAHDKALREALEKNQHYVGSPLEDVPCITRDVLIDELHDAYAEMGKLLESAKTNVIDGFDNDLLPSILCQIEAFDADKVQKYYIVEAICDSPNIVERSKEIKPLYLKYKLPIAVKKKYQEAVFCYLAGRYDASSVMCRAILEMMLRELFTTGFGDKFMRAKYSLKELINQCGNLGLMQGQDLSLAKKIKNRGNDSIHTDKLANRQDALDQLKDTQNFLQSSWCKKLGARHF
ncbi:MAG: DUF4145 domain-containing protein [Candidatus Aenigmarchaeota archaeon]|nr:DUF4145 domain-containing protein [Candidatus Aenigmarchaeota archaeon]